MREFISCHIIGANSDCNSEYIFRNMTIPRGIYMMHFGYNDISFRIIKL